MRAGQIPSAAAQAPAGGATALGAGVSDVHKRRASCAQNTRRTCRRWPKPGALAAIRRRERRLMPSGARRSSASAAARRAASRTSVAAAAACMRAPALAPPRQLRRQAGAAAMHCAHRARAWVAQGSARRPGRACGSCYALGPRPSCDAAFIGAAPWRPDGLARGQGTGRPCAARAPADLAAVAAAQLHACPERALPHLSRRAAGSLSA